MQLLERLLERVVVGDARGGLDHLRQRPVRDALAVREAAAREDARALEAVDELARQPALPDARLAEDGEQVGAAVAHGAIEGVLQQLELGLAPDERRARASGPRPAVDRTHHAPGAKWAADPLELERPGVLDDEARPRKAVRRRPDEDLPRTRGLLKARGEVHRLAGHERGLDVLHDELAGLDPDPATPGRARDLLAHRERRASRALRVVLVRLRDTERGEHRVAGELLDDPAVRP